MIVLELHLRLIQNKIWRGSQNINSKQMPQRLPMALPQVKVGDTSENLLNEIKKIIYSLY